MAGLVIILAAVAAACLAFVAWLASLATGFTCPAWCETTAVFIACVLILIGAVGDWRTRA